jgi:hypothetical protein
MTNIKPSDHGIVVENKESGIRYASLDQNFDPTSERKIRDLKPGESVLSYQPKLAAQSSEEDAGEPGAPAPTPGAAGDAAVGSGDSQPTTSRTTTK